MNVMIKIYGLKTQEVVTVRPLKVLHPNILPFFREIYSVVFFEILKDDIRLSTFFSNLDTASLMNRESRVLRIK